MIDSEKIANEKLFIQKTISAFNMLFSDARQKNELHFAFALTPGVLPYKYNPAIEANIAFQQYRHFLQNNDYPEIRPRIALAFYCHLAEARGYWEIIKNMLCISTGERYSTNPFGDIIKKHSKTGETIAPNVNRLFQSLIGYAKFVGKDYLIEILKHAYDSDLRHSFAHADYVLIEKGVVIKNRDGCERVILWEEFEKIINRGINFYGCLLDIVAKHMEMYSEKKIVNGRLADEPTTSWSIYYSSETGLFDIRTPPI